MTENDKILMKRQQSILGWLCILLPVLSVGLASIGRNVPGWYESISATYYTNSKMFLIGLLFSCGVYFWAYKGYDIWDKIITSLSAIFAFAIVAFPTGGNCMPDLTEKVGLLNIPVSISHTVHCLSAAILYTTFVIQALRFRKHGDTMTKEKKIRNTIYLVCVILMLFGTGIVFSAGKFEKPWLVFVGECFLQFSYGFCWLVKGEVIKCLNDK